MSIPVNFRSRGVGLKFEGYPSDEEKFRWILMQEGCHPKAVERILERLRLNGFDLLTVMDGIYFKWLEESLKEVNVTMSFIQPQENWESKYQDGAWSEDILEEVFRRREERRKSNQL